MRTEKTEFSHIDEVVRRIALARFDIAITLNHNGKMYRQYRANKPLPFEWQHGDLALRGWIANPSVVTPAFAELQYCYVNGRMMRDRLINHAIRQACEQQAGKDSNAPAFVLYLDVDSSSS
ncbi:unnamed protein product [Ranitomeya imitator]|uniref:DNA mismatch repair protein S5 domain-containing protein n=1 Tax=Ranitomeya imitator TaxID=111125 RepID=A0ABN9LLU2_9NEOB|nr:unnamed protein product [Ranitomeya imitator]